MKSNQIPLACLAALLITFVSPPTQAGPPDAANSKVHFPIADSADYTMVLYVLPDGTGPGLTNAKVLDPFLGTINATILVELRDSDDVLVIGYPAVDVWLEARDGGLSMCSDNPAIADFNSEYRAGLGFEYCTEFSGPFYGGGHTDLAAGDQVVVMTASTGSTPITSPLNDLQMNSADINGDLIIDLNDVPLFTSDYYLGVYVFRSDFHADGFVNLSDIGVFATTYNKSCP
ncbi:MAG: hypothetical protein IPJ24_14760 [bacterium]|nr:hypothetical protein [bacterium]